MLPTASCHRIFIHSCVSVGHVCQSMRCWLAPPVSVLKCPCDCSSQKPLACGWDRVKTSYHWPELHPDPLPCGTCILYAQIASEQTPPLFFVPLLTVPFPGTWREYIPPNSGGDGDSDSLSGPGARMLHGAVVWRGRMILHGGRLRWVPVF